MAARPKKCEKCKSSNFEKLTGASVVKGVLGGGTAYAVGAALGILGVVEPNAMRAAAGVFKNGNKMMEEGVWKCKNCGKYWGLDLDNL